MIAYRDFATKAGRWIPAADLAASVEEANEWLAAAGVAVINVETITTSVNGVSFFTCVRVWYRAGPSKPEPLPEL